MVSSKRAYRNHLIIYSLLCEYRLLCYGLNNYKNIRIEAQIKYIINKSVRDIISVM